MIQLRDPWGYDSYTGPWNDDDDIWTEEYKEQVPYGDVDDGLFFMDHNTFMEAFDRMTISYHDEFAVMSYIKIERDDGNSKIIQFRLEEELDVF